MKKWSIIGAFALVFIISGIPIDAYTSRWGLNEKDLHHAWQMRRNMAKYYENISASERRLTSTEQNQQRVGIKVYDANEQFLGILLDASFKRSSAYVILLPSLNVATVILEDIETGIADIMLSHGNVYFEDRHCSGSAYLGTFGTSPNILYRFGHRDASPRYFFGIGPREKGFAISSRINLKGECSRWVNSKFRHGERGYRALEISREEMPFALPVALPLRYEW